jgi:hypothetical protein
MGAHSKVGLKANMKETVLDERGLIDGRFPIGIYNSIYIESPNSFGELS